MRHLHAPSFCKSLWVVLLVSMSSLLFAKNIACEATQHPLCKASFKAARETLEQQQLTALLVTDAPVKLLNDSALLWLQRSKQCRTSRCVQQQIDLRQNDLNLYISLNQSLTQHYLKYDAGKLAVPAVHLKVHQLDKEHLKIEGVAYRSPNNRNETQQINFLAYTTPEKKQQIQNNEQLCHYQFDFQNAILKVSSDGNDQQGCERFNGIYRLYD